MCSKFQLNRNTRKKKKRHCCKRTFLKGGSGSSPRRTNAVFVADVLNKMTTSKPIQLPVLSFEALADAASRRLEVLQRVPDVPAALEAASPSSPLLPVVVAFAVNSRLQRSCKRATFSKSKLPTNNATCPQGPNVYG